MVVPTGSTGSEELTIPETASFGLAALAARSFRAPGLGAVRSSLDCIGIASSEARSSKNGEYQASWVFQEA